jgi:hypothetical protein
MLNELHGDRIVTADALRAYLEETGAVTPKSKRAGQRDGQQQPSPQPSKLQLLHLGDLVAVPRRLDLVRRVLPRGAQMELYGPPKSGKSLVALDLALAIAEGRPWLGHEVTQGPVVYVSSEGGAASLRYRVAAVVGNARVNHAEDPLRSKFWCLPRMVPDLCSPKGCGELVDAMLALPEKPVLCIIDTVARALASSGLNENATQDMSQFVQVLDAIRDGTDAASVVVHHAGKDGTDRGSIALRAAVDVIAKIERDGDNISKLKFEATRDGECPKPVAIRFGRTVVDEDESGQVVYWRVDGVEAASDQQDRQDEAKKVRTRERVFEAMAETGDDGLTFTAARQAASKTDSTTSYTLDALVKDGRAVPFTDAKGNKRWRIRKP